MNTACSTPEDSMSNTNNRRQFLGRVATASAGLALSWKRAAAAPTANDLPALLGGTPVHKGSWPKWPEWRQSWEPSLIDVLRSGRWYRGAGGHVADFET